MVSMTVLLPGPRLCVTVLPELAGATLVLSFYLGITEPLVKTAPSAFSGRVQTGVPRGQAGPFGKPYLW